MKRKAFLRIWLFSLFLPIIANFGFAAGGLPNALEIPILTEDSERFLETQGDDRDVIRDGSYGAIQGQNNDEKIENLIESKQQIENQADATQRTLALIKRIVNFALGFVSLIALILLIIAGIKMTTANGDDKAFGAGKETLTTIVKAIGGIAISRFLISGIFRFLEKIL